MSLDAWTKDAKQIADGQESFFGVDRTILPYTPKPDPWHWRYRYAVVQFVKRLMRIDYAD